MKTASYLLGVISIGVGLSAFNMNGPIEVGDDAPLQETQMLGVDGETTSLLEAKDENGLLVIFSCNTCPYVLAWEDQYPILKELADEQSIGMILVNSNSMKRNGDDSIDAMKEHASEMNYDFPYVVDENNALADAFEAQTTPHVFLLDGDMKLVFEGSINDKFENRDKVATNEWLRDAMQKLGSGNANEIDPANTRQTGCSIKRK
ncbi:MAG: redoxin domain-containing protein [Bacteroidetes bacterium]|nr:MAG: redoxin domain-containing protein [Bacteroidota bacterium]